MIEVLKKGGIVKRRMRRRSEWGEIVRAQEASGLSAPVFCQGNSIGLASFYQWRRRIRSEMTPGSGDDNAAGRFIKVGEIDSAGRARPTKMSTSREPWVVTLDLGEGLKLTVQRG